MQSRQKRKSFMKHQNQLIKQHQFVVLPFQGAPRLWLLIMSAGFFAAASLSSIALGQCLDGCNATNTFQGNNALPVATGGENTATGAYALFSNTSGSHNTATGASALFYNAADNNTANGYHALYNNTTGNSNLADGNLALSNNATGGSNIAIGDSAGINLTTGS